MNNHLYEKATIYMEAGDLVRAEKWYRKLLKVDPDHAEGCLNYGAMKKNRGDLKGALELFKRCISSRPRWAFPYNNIGLIYHNWNQEDTAVPYFRRALELDPEYADAHWNLALSLLKTSFSSGSDPSEGWMHYSWRFKKSGPVVLSVVPSLPIWTTDMDRTKCLVVAEQGFGDVIMMLPYCNGMTMYTDGRFSDLFDALGVPWTSSTDGFESWIPMMSLAAFAPRVSGALPLVGGDDIGVCWAGNPQHGNDKNRSRSDSDFAWLGTAKSFQFGTTSRIFGECVTTSWAESIAELRKLRCLVTVDTSIAHLAGYLGVQTCVLVPSIDTDFRWGLKRNDCVWYPSVFVARNMQEVKEYVNRITS